LQILLRESESSALLTPFSQVLVTRSFAHLRAVFREYAQMTSSDILRAIESEMSGNLKSGMKARV
jgi:hypothetical protein